MAISKTSMAAAAAEEEAKQVALRKRAARQAAKREGKPPVHPVAECRVLPMGADKVSMGQHVAGFGDAYYEKGETFAVAEPIARELEERGYVEITNVIAPPAEEPEDA